MRGFIDPQIGEIRTRDRDSIADNRHIAAQHQTRTLGAARPRVAERVERAADNPPRGLGERGVAGAG